MSATLVVTTASLKASAQIAATVTYGAAVSVAQAAAASTSSSMKATASVVARIYT